MHVPVEVIVDGVINTLLVLPAIAQVERGYADVIEKSSEVGARTEGIDTQVGALPQFLLFVRGLSLGNLRQLQPLPRSQLGFRILNVARDSVDELLERMRAPHAEDAAIVAVGIDVDGCVLAQLFGMRLDPLG